MGVPRHKLRVDVGLLGERAREVVADGLAEVEDCVDDLVCKDQPCTVG